MTRGAQPGASYSFIAMRYELPKTVNIRGEDHPIRYDFRAILEIMSMLQDDELTPEEKAEALLEMFYLEPVARRDRKEAVDKCFAFMDADSDRPQKKHPKLTDFEQDFEFIIAPVNRVLGYESRAVEYDPENNTGGVHWWTFLAAYMEIGGDCLYSQIVSIRDKKQRRKKLEKWEKDWLRRNSDIVNLRTKYTDEENKFFNEWGG